MIKMTVVYCAKEECKFNKNKICSKKEIILAVPTYRAMHVYCLDFEKRSD